MSPSNRWCVGRLPPADQLKVIGAIAELRPPGQRVREGIQWRPRMRRGRSDPSVPPDADPRPLPGRRVRNAARLVKEQIEAEEKADPRPTEEKLQFLASCY